MSENGVESVAQLEAYYEERVLELCRAAGRSYIVWQVRCCTEALQGPAHMLFSERLAELLQP
jgi:protein tyrosine phosphatase (PTP) superfamily phosphohydrolase (DUF442 family)